MDRWKGKTAVVTGASAGIGAAIAVQLANAGLCVVGIARRSHLVEELRSQVRGSGSIQSYKCDITKLDDVTAAFKRIEELFGCIHVLVNNAGVFNTGHITDIAGGQLSDEQLLSMMDTNVTATIMCTRHAIATMKKQSFDGHVININSAAGHYIPFSELFNVYSSSKHAVTAFTGALLNELAHLNSGIKVTSISPGLVDTAMAEAVRDMPMMKPDNIAEMVIYALSLPPSVNISEMTVHTVREKRM